VLVNVVGGIIRKLAVDHPPEDWQRVIDINLKDLLARLPNSGKDPDWAKKRPYH
jgi:hypothetical protein